MKQNKIDVRVGYDNSFPRSRGAITIRGNSVAVDLSGPAAYGNQEREPVECAGRFDLEIINLSRQAQDVSITIDWGKASLNFMKYFDYAFVRHKTDPDWIVCCGYAQGTQSVIAFKAKPGATLFCQHPRYSYTDCEKFVKTVSHARHVETLTAGKSGEGRNIWMLNMTDSAPGDDKLKVMVMARNHAYESAGSYCVEGMVRFLQGEDLWAGYFLKKFRFFFMPMTNPDGVYNGLSRYTSARGTDLNRLVTPADKAHATIKRAIDQVQPHLFVNIHHWLSKYYDGLLCTDKVFAQRFRLYMPDQTNFGKIWYVETKEDLIKKYKGRETPAKSKSWKNYCYEKYGTMALTLEFPWFGRNGQAMRRTGVEALKAALWAYRTYKEEF